MDRLIKNSQRVWRVFTVIAGFFMAASVVVICANIIMRRFFNTPIYGSTEMVAYMGLIIGSFSLIDNEWGDGNITLTIFLDKMKKKTRYTVCAVVHLIEAAVFIVLDFLFIRDFLNKVALGTHTPDLDIPRWVPAIVLALGFTFLTIALVIKAVLYLMTVKKDGEIDFGVIGRIPEDF